MSVYSMEMESNKNFERRIENFTCENCGTEVLGNGYTDHCPQCLYSKHVDINPGDRNNDCCGLMIPVAAEVTRKGFRIYYTCQKCGDSHRVKSTPEDNFEKILELVGKPF